MIETFNQIIDAEFNLDPQSVDVIDYMVKHNDDTVDPIPSRAKANLETLNRNIRVIFGDDE